MSSKQKVAGSSPASRTKKTTMVEVKYKDPAENRVIKVSNPYPDAVYVRIEKETTPDEKGVVLDMVIPRAIARVLAEVLK